jgi:hypothetical protein
MKKALVERTSPVVPRPEHTGWWTTVQVAQDILILNVYKNMILQCRHCMNIETGEHMSLKHGIWRRRKIQDAYDIDYSFCGPPDSLNKTRFKMSKADARLIRDTIGKRKEHWWLDVPGKEILMIDTMEQEFNSERRAITERNRIDRVNALMAKVPEAPADQLREWIDQLATGGMDYCFKDETMNVYCCSHCGGKTVEKMLVKADGTKRIRNRDMVICPNCKKTIQMRRRIKRLEIKTHFMMLQPVNDEYGVSRFFDVKIVCDGGKKRIDMDEAVRIMLRKNQPGCDIYYNQYNAGYAERYGLGGIFDNKHNPANRREYEGYLFDGGIGEALKRTSYEICSRLFAQLSASGACLNYNRIMASSEPNLVNLIEMLHKGRFHHLAYEMSKRIHLPYGSYYGELRLSGRTMEDIFGISDRQKINRIREHDGGTLMLEWMRWSDRNKKKLSDQVIDWLQEYNIQPEDLKFLKLRFSVEQAMNYIMRQKTESYPRESVKSIIYQYEDYMRMCERLHKDTNDEMVYRPRELKRRHDEAVKEIELREADLEAEKYSEKYGEAEQVLRDVKARYEYAGAEYFVMVPERIVDIVKEGRALHHCVGSTDRYFDRIKQRETYICFLRKKSEPDVPFYTVEVEPGGTIRQNRGAYDEQPDIETIRPFLREWQKVIRKRMTEEDRRLEQVSAQKREENLEDLRKKNNVRVLQGLMEDFMEAEAI